MVTVRLALLPPMTMFAGGTRLVLDESATRVSDAAGVKSSPNVTAMAPVAVSSLIVWFETSAMVGALLANAMPTEDEAVAVPSVAL